MRYSTVYMNDNREEYGVVASVPKQGLQASVFCMKTARTKPDYICTKPTHQITSHSWWKNLTITADSDT